MTTHPTDAAAPTATTPGRAAVGIPAGSATPGQLPAGPECPPGLARAAALMSEAEVERQVRQIARELGLLVYHTHDSRRSHSGWPDWVLSGRCGVIFRELKRQDGKPTKAQQAWLDALTTAGMDAGVYRPSDLLTGRLAAELAALAGIGAAA